MYVCLDQNFEPSLLTNKLWLIFMGKKQNFFFFFLKKKIQNGRLKKSAFFKIANSQNFFVKISWISPWVSRIDWCEGHWCGSTLIHISKVIFFFKFIIGCLLWHCSLWNQKPSRFIRTSSIISMPNSNGVTKNNPLVWYTYHSHGDNY